MENSKINAKAIRLGNELVKVLELARGDILARWMAHYIAEQMTLAESALGPEKAVAQSNCFNTILKLWQHRAFLPEGLRPFEKFDVIFRVLERLEPGESGGLYRELWESRVAPEPDTVESFASMITSIDEAARLLIEQAVSLAVCAACEESDETMLGDADVIEYDAGILLIREITKFNCREDLTPEIARKREIEKIKMRLNTLSRFEAAAQGLRRLLSEEMLRLDQEQ